MTTRGTVIVVESDGPPRTDGVIVRGVGLTLSIAAAPEPGTLAIRVVRDGLVTSTLWLDASPARTLADRIGAIVDGE